jgi:PPIC-type PPIASE domain
MSRSSRLIVALSIAAVFSATVIRAQDKPAPLIGDPTKQAAPTTRLSGPLPPLVFKSALPKTPIGTIDGTPVTQGDLLLYLMKGNWQIVTQTLILANLLDIELKKAKIELTDDEIKDEQVKILERLAPGKTLEQVKATGAFSENELRRQAWLSRGWDRIFMAENKLPQDNTANNANQILKQLFIRQKMEKYEVKQRGQDPGPSPGYIAEIKEKEGTEVRKVTADDALGFLMGLVKPGSLRDAANEVVDAKLVDREMAKADKAVTEEQVENWAASMQDKYKPPFDWRMICQFKGTTPDAERERWRKLQAWRQVTGFEVKPEELKAFIAANEDHFSGQNKNVSHILLMTTDPVTAREGSSEADAAAKKKADLIREKLEEGVDFGYLAEHFSDDATTAKNKGVLNTPIKKLGGGLDPAFQKAAWSLKLGEISGPVKSKFGYHIIKCEKVTPGQRGGKDFEEPSFREWIVDEYETIKMKEWLEGLRTKAKIEIVPDSELQKLKDLTF